MRWLLCLIPVWALAQPVVEDVTEYNGTAAGSHEMSYPATVDAGDLAVLFSCIDGGQLLSAIDNFTEVLAIDHTQAAGDGRYVHVEILDGDEDGANFTYNNNGSEEVVSQMYRISGHSVSTIATDVDTASVESGSSDVSTIDPAEVTAGWGSAQNLFLAAAYTDDDETFSDYPDNYTDGLQENVTDGCTIASARRSLTAALDDPNSFTWGANEEASAASVVIQGPAAGLSPAILCRRQTCD